MIRMILLCLTTAAIFSSNVLAVRATKTPRIKPSFHQVSITRTVKRSKRNIQIVTKSKIPLLWLYRSIHTTNGITACNHCSCYRHSITFPIYFKSYHHHKTIQQFVPFFRTLQLSNSIQPKQKHPTNMGVISDDTIKDNNIVYKNKNDEYKIRNSTQSEKAMNNNVDTKNDTTAGSKKVRRSKRQRSINAIASSKSMTNNQSFMNETLIHTTGNTILQKRTKITSAFSRIDNENTDIVPMTPQSSSSLNFHQAVSEVADPCVSMNHTRMGSIENNSYIDDATRNITNRVTPEPVLSNVATNENTKPNRTLSFFDTRNEIETVPYFSSNHQCTTTDGYIDLNIPPCEFRPSASLTTGQCFHWKAVATTSSSHPITEITTISNQQVEQQQQSAWGIHNAMEWVGILRVAHLRTSSSPLVTSSKTENCTNSSDMSISTIVVSIRETPETTLFKTLYSESHVNVTHHLLSYIQIIPSSSMQGDKSDLLGEDIQHQKQEENISLQDLYTEWSSQCPRLKQIASCIPGVRVLNQDPWECFVSFLCSSNNNIPRITKILQSIREEYGTELPVQNNNDYYNDDDEASDSITTKYYSFPSLHELMMKATESDLRTKCGMGYRARYLIESMKLLSSLGGEKYLHTLKYSTNYNDPILVQEQLLQFMGIGRKVADCIALFSLNQCTSIPVDVHVWNIARRDYVNSSSSNDKQQYNLLRNATTVTPTIYTAVGTIFRQRFPTKSGWAHSLLFVAELPSFRPVLPMKLLEEMDRFKLADKKRKESK